MWCLFVYFIIFFVPGLFAVLVYNLLTSSKMQCCKAIISALMYDLLILGINLAGLRFIKGILTFEALQPYFNCLSFTPKYILLSLIVAIVLAVIAWLLSRLFSGCNKRCHHYHNCD